MSVLSTPVRTGVFSLFSLFRWASVPGSPEEVRGFWQRRMRIYLGFTAIFWAVAWLMTTLLSLLTRAEETLLGAGAIRMALHLGMAIALGILWWATRRGERSLRWLMIVDLATTTMQGVVIGSLIVGMLPLIRYRPDVLFILGVTYSLVARAAVIPSGASRTVLVGIFACIPVCIGILVVYRMAFATGISVSHFYPGDRSTPTLFLLWAIVYCSLSIALSAFVSFVIFGLQRAVQQARQLGQYTLEAKIGEGGMGVVYRGRHALLRRPTALKLLPPERAGAGTIARFEREVQITSTLTHPNTVAIYDYGRTPENVFYYAMEYLVGTDLEVLVRQDGPQPPGRVRHVIGQVLGALAEAHALGIIHRDIKPSNVYLCERGLVPDFVKVLDFGLARDFDPGRSELTQAGQLTGTPLYMSPEQILGAPLDGRSDLYALGALAYYLLTGAPVFAGITAVEVCAHHLHSPVVSPSERLGRPLPVALENLVLACLEKEPAQRPESAASLLSSLDACLDVSAWTPADARRWWSEHGQAVRASANAESEVLPARLTVNVAVDRVA
jgi:eukaryotic-like serine/threonine-protein kinase